MTGADVESGHRPIDEGGPEVVLYARWPSRCHAIRVQRELAASRNGWPYLAGNGTAARALLLGLMNHVRRFFTRGCLCINHNAPTGPVRDVAEPNAVR